jgi:signal transduction histidine kinase
MTRISIPETIAKLESAVSASLEGRAPETAVLLEALTAAREYQQLAEAFDARVAEARIEALRELAYGAGHEINNPLANIAARAQALLPEEHDPERRKRLATIVDQAFRARDMIGGLMIFARPPRAQLVETTLDDVVRPVIESLHPLSLARHIRLEYSPPPAPVALHVDATQVGEAVRMLLVNAFEAVDDGGRIRVEAVLNDADRGHIVVADNGHGMDAETASKADDPFFSGREAGRGIGMGLPKARRLVEASGGTLAIESRPGHGTRCLIALPIRASVA